MTENGYAMLFNGFAVALGAVVGSFLNVCIYRLPLDLSLNKPPRSFCPACHAQIPWYQNIPVLSWIVLQGKCATCGAKISVRYIGVELLTAALFLLIWRAFPPAVAIAYWVFVSLLLVGTFIDFEHFIIPDQITIGGTVAGIVASFVLPELQAHAQSRAAGLVRAVLAAALGYLALLFVLEAGKLAFGKKRVKLDGPTPFTWKRQNEDAEFGVGAERTLWSDHFARETDRLLLQCNDANIDGEVHNNVTLEFHYDRVTVERRTWQLDHVADITGTATELQIPREAMGRGDLKFLACIGGFLGWRAVLFSIFAGSLAGSLVGVTTMLIGKRVWSAKLPFGPYLAFGAVLWMFCGEAFVAWYMGLLNPV